jgi:hypothetical protein
MFLHRAPAYGALRIHRCNIPLLRVTGAELRRPSDWIEEAIDAVPEARSPIEGVRRFYFAHDYLVYSLI